MKNLKSITYVSVALALVGFIASSCATERSFFYGAKESDKAFVVKIKYRGYHISALERNGERIQKVFAKTFPWGAEWQFANPLYVAPGKIKIFFTVNGAYSVSESSFDLGDLKGGDVVTLCTWRTGWNNNQRIHTGHVKNRRCPRRPPGV